MSDAGLDERRDITCSTIRWDGKATQPLTEIAARVVAKQPRAVRYTVSTNTAELAMQKFRGPFDSLATGLKHAGEVGLVASLAGTGGGQTHRRLHHGEDVQP